MLTAASINARKTPFTATSVGARELGLMKFGVTPGGGSSVGISDKGTPVGIDISDLPMDQIMADY